MMTKTHKKQHTIPRSYLASWLEPVTPPGQTSAIHLVSKGDQTVRRKSPVKTFTETDRYTIHLKDGTRDLRVENALSQVESDFQGVLRALRQKLKLLPLHRRKLAVFTAAMLGRSKRQRDWMLGQWKQVQDIVDQVERAHDAGTASSEEMADFLANHHARLVVETIQTVTPILLIMNLKIFTSDDPNGFISSDTPAVMCNPFAYKYPPKYRAPGFAQRNIEVTLPLSPHHFAMYSHGLPTFSYSALDKNMVDELNRRTAAFARAILSRAPAKSMLTGSKLARVLGTLGRIFKQKHRTIHKSIQKQISDLSSHH
jgi:hypothetical protein